MAIKKVKAPAGYHWMKKGSSYNLMKHTGRRVLIVGYFGGIGISNALNSFFEIINKLHDNCEIHFVIAGEGDLKKTYYSQKNHA